jgi:hypothetical protein
LLNGSRSVASSLRKCTRVDPPTLRIYAVVVRGRVTRPAASLAFALALLPLFGCGDGTRAPQPDPGISMLDPSKAHHGKTYADWAVAYMKWQFETPLPILWDVKGCTTGQSKDSPVAFLDQGAATKTRPAPCTLGAEQSTFFPLLPLGSEAAYYTDSVMPLPSTDANVLEDRVKRYMRDLVIDDAEITVDGRALREPTSGELSPTFYSYEPWPGDNLLYGAYSIPNAAIPATVDAFVAGYWVLLAPLAAGEHQLSLSIHVHLNGKVVRNEFTYELLVE